jgi:predicted GIY-YIG superfamily endonuclease
MHYVYILNSLVNISQSYIGSTTDLKKRLESHNYGENKHTSKFKPWKIVWYCAFLSKERAVMFEKYLKTSSGIAFRRKRLI